jgi:hypothetical protein
MSEIMLMPNLAQVKIGTRLAIYWPDDDKY